MKIISLALLATSVLSLHAADEWVLPKGEPALKPGKNAPLVTGQCLVCHSVDYITTQPPLTRAAWEAIVVKMRDKYGAPIPPAHLQSVVDYLAANYGKR